MTSHDPPPGEKPELAGYVKELRVILGRRLSWALVLLVSGALLEGVGLLLLVPLLDLIGEARGEGPSPGGIVGLMVDSVGALGFPVTLETVLVILLGLIVARAALVRTQATLSAELAQEATLVLRERLFRAISYARWVHFVRTRQSDFLQALTTDIGRVGSGTHYLLQLLSASFLLAAYLLAATAISPLLTLLATSFGLLGLGILWSRIREAQALGAEATGVGKQFFATASEHLSGLKLARSFGAEERSISRFTKHTRDSFRTTVSFVRNRAGAQMWFTVSTALMLLAFVFVSVEFFHSPSAEILILLAVFSRAAPRMTAIHLNLQQLQHAHPAYDSYLEMVSRCREEAVEPRDVSLSPISLRESIHLVGVRFRYSQDSEEVLKGVDARISAGATTGIVGPSGAGKSTMADLIMGLLVPDEGIVMVDGVELTEALAPGWRSRVGYVPQDTYLFNDTVRANLLWARPDASDAELWKALDHAAVGEVVRALPEGMGTRVGDRGVRLSGGERQRLSLARALLLDPTVLILDEATSHLDSRNIEIIQEALENLPSPVTKIVITHRLDTIENADHIIVLDGGRVTRSGSWKELAQP